MGCLDKTGRKKMYEYNKKNGKVKYASHFLGTLRGNYFAFNPEMEFSIEDVEKVLKIMKDNQ